MKFLSQINTSIVLKRQNGLALFLCLTILMSINSYCQPIAEGKSKFLGNAITDQNSFHSNFSKYWNQVTSGNSGKWGHVESSPGNYNWTGLDTIYHYALANGFPYKHHCLIWGNQQPTFMTDGSLDSAAQRAEIENWIRLVGERYPDMDMIDVVNEPIHAVPAYFNALGGSGETGWDWVITSFNLARTYCAPGVKLILNEYSILGDYNATSAYLRIIDTLKVRGLIDAIGIQGHYFEFKGSGYSWPISSIKSNLDRLAATGLPIYITEFDINEADDDVQLANYKTYFPIFWEHPAVQGITLWGYYYDDVWQGNAYLIDERRAERPALKWLRNYVISPFPPLLISPKGTTGEARNPLLVWHASDSAATYHLQVSVSSAFTTFIVDTSVVDTVMQLNPLDSNTRYYWRVSAANSKGESDFSSSTTFLTGSQIVDVKESEIIPAGFALSQNYPNPFNPSTVISYQVPVTAHISLKVYNLLGQEVLTLFEGIRSPGSYKSLLNGDKLSGGVYFYRLTSNKFVETKKLLLIK